MQSKPISPRCECEHNNPDSLDARLFLSLVLAVAPAVTMDGVRRVNPNPQTTYMLNTWSEENTVLRSYVACFMNTLTLGYVGSEVSFSLYKILFLMLARRACSQLD